MSHGESVFFGSNCETLLLPGLPSMNMMFEEMKHKMGEFTVKFDKFVMNMREKKLEERNRYLKSVGEDREIQRNLQKQIEECKEIEKRMQEAIEREKQEVIEAERSIAEFKEKKEVMMEKREYLLQKIQDISQTIQKKREFRSNMRHMFIKQAAKDKPELEFWEEHLAMKIKGVKDDFLKIIFTHIDENDWMKEFYFIINLSKREYEVTECSPALATVHEIVSKLNTCRDFFGFLKDMRKAFKKSIQSS
ncbi:hypothetical protein T552_02752 [Pneumocystis carinii B80]|uniref:Kinetochore protein SPC25 n=1 Tax=Pneumocystis carinii (strain B80) TaxID=1408658 RepID=A0A0W4ZEE2_PNEC8|nr:hypothetical protein T552_02752 [Pneumocystis carinii B80]KTW26748.1 hypothetical protein T552_02752 [Pneumocystis carinii B80]